MEKWDRSEGMTGVCQFLSRCCGMRIQFKVQKYQTEAVESVVNVFRGQGRGVLFYSSVDGVFRNSEIALSDEALLENIQMVQRMRNLKVSRGLVKGLGRCSLDVEMETGTGKSYVYIKTIFELHKHYGWCKFIIVVSSLAIREGVRKSFELTAEHFMQFYGKKARFFVYQSSSLHELEQFASSSDIQVMIINTQAFASSLKEDGKSKEARIIYSKRDEFGSRMPIDVICSSRPIVILDEPQKMGGEVTQKALARFEPLFSLYYSATHKTQHHQVYVLDALEAYHRRLVKKIEVKGIELRAVRGRDGYLYAEQMVLSMQKAPMVRIIFERRREGGIERVVRVLGVGDDLYSVSGKLEQYKGFRILEIDVCRGLVHFSNGESIKVGEALGDVSEAFMRRMQIRETILSHFEKEERLFAKGIKVLSLFFVDEVSKYRQYGHHGEEILGEYGRIFEEEYRCILEEYLKGSQGGYRQYLERYCCEVGAVHQGYFSIDKCGRMIDSCLRRGSECSEDISAYELILKDKERLLRFEEATRFIFSHSALREGWDNPNVFQICTLKHSESQIAKRQEVGRGLRLCINQDGERMDFERCGETVHDVNVLTVVASESYQSFVRALQSEIKTVLCERPRYASREYFLGKCVKAGGVWRVIDQEMADEIENYLIQNGYVGDDGCVRDSYRKAVVDCRVAVLPDSLGSMSEGIHYLIQSIYDEGVVDRMFCDGHQFRRMDDSAREGEAKKAFHDLWHAIHHKYIYRVDFDSEELIRKSIDCIREKLVVSELGYRMVIGRQKAVIGGVGRDDFGAGDVEDRSFSGYETESDRGFDLVGKISEGTRLRRRTVVRILCGIGEEKLRMFRHNPEEFISRVVGLIKEQRSTRIVEHVFYDAVEGVSESCIFTVHQSFEGVRAFLERVREVQSVICGDGIVKNGGCLKDFGVLDGLCVYTQLPKGFKILTPIGDYVPDWGISFSQGGDRHVFFIAETKGSMESIQLSPIGHSKSVYGRGLFESVLDASFRYRVLDSYQSLMQVMDELKSVK